MKPRICSKKYIKFLHKNRDYLTFTIDFNQNDKRYDLILLE